MKLLAMQQMMLKYNRLSWRRVNETMSSDQCERSRFRKHQLLNGLYLFI